MRGYPVAILDTRKTLPGWRAIQKWAVTLGGGTNHRFSLADGVLVKDNHLSLLPQKTAIRQACILAKSRSGSRMPIIVEVESLADVAEALTGQADIILLDNMTPVMVKKAVRMIKGRALVEVSGRNHFEKHSCHGSGRPRPHFDRRAHALRSCRRDDAGAPTGRCQAEEASLTAQLPSPLNVHAIQSYLGTRSLGRRIELYERLESTNREAVALGQAGVEHGTLVLADAQTAGRGRMARSWFSPPGVNLYGSLVIRTTIEAPHLAAWLSWLPLMAALAAAEGIEIVSGLPIAVKWPNDLLINERKLGGILCESGAPAGAGPFQVIGIGINVNGVPEDFPEELTSHCYHDPA